MSHVQANAGHPPGSDQPLLDTTVENCGFQGRSQMTQSPTTSNTARSRGMANGGPATAAPKATKVPDKRPTICISPVSQRLHCDPLLPGVYRQAAPAANSLGLRFALFAAPPRAKVDPQARRPSPRVARSPGRNAPRQSRSRCCDRPDRPPRVSLQIHEKKKNEGKHRLYPVWYCLSHAPPPCVPQHLRTPPAFALIPFPGCARSPAGHRRTRTTTC